MIKKLSIYIAEGTNPYRNLAVEEFLTLHTQPGEVILYLWQNQKTVVIGKNQNAWKECKVEALKEDGGHLVRRLSGGGAVFHDLGNLNFTFCVRKEAYDVARQLSVILEALRMLGIHAEKTGRNDITADGRKFSGNAFYKTGVYCYHHGTLLVDTDREQMARYLTVSKAKLQSKGVESVRSRTVNLKELKGDITVEMLKESLADGFCRVYGHPVEPLDAARLDWDAIRLMELRFASREWIVGRNIPFTEVLQHRFVWGEVELRLDVCSGKIRQIHLFTDAMEDWLAPVLEQALEGAEYDMRILEERIRAVPMESEQEETLKNDLISLLKGEIADG